jgi:hypothetical protein
MAGYTGLKDPRSDGGRCINPYDQAKGMITVRSTILTFLPNKRSVTIKPPPPTASALCRILVYRLSPDPATEGNGARNVSTHEHK